jgi:hypothetical protein
VLRAGATSLFIAVLVLAGSAQAADIGANDDTGKYLGAASAPFFDRMVALGLKQNVMTARFQQGNPDLIQDQESLDVAIPLAQAAGLDVTLAVYPYPPWEIDSGIATPVGFAAWLTRLATRYPTVKQFVIMNEPNQPAFLRPQFTSAGRNASAARAGAFLAAAYDALKAFDPTIHVIGIGLSPRGNDRPRARSNISTSPIRFLAALGTWYRASGRTRPLMDGFSFHPYPNQATDPLTRGYPWPNAGFANLDRIKQGLWDAFHGTAQPTPANGLRLYLDEVGWQVTTVGLPGYTGTENVAVTTAAKQGAIYASLVRQSACDPQIAEVNIFGFYDDRPRDTGFQAGLNTVDGVPRASSDSVRAAIAATAGGCPRGAAPWQPTREVVDPALSSPMLDTGGQVRFDVTTGEGANVVACLLPGRPGPGAVAAAMRRRAGASLGCSSGVVLPRHPRAFTLRRLQPLRAATVAVRLAAEANPARTSVLSLPVG